MLRVGELVRHALADVLTRGEVMDPVLEKHVITVPEVRMSPDLKLATAYVMPLGGKDSAAVLKALDTLPAGVDRSEALGAIPVEMSTATRETAARGKLNYVDPSVEATAGTVRVRAEFPNPDGRLLPGQFARLRMGEARDANAVLVSERAIGVDQDKTFVLVVGDDDRAAYREVRLGESANGLKIVLSGLVGGERVVVEGLQKLKPGALVAPEPVAAGDPRAAGKQALAN